MSVNGISDDLAAEAKWPKTVAEEGSSVKSSTGDIVSEDDLTEEERRAERSLVWRLDLIFLVYGFVGSVFKSIDQTNISNAYVSGMQTDLALHGNQLNYFTTYFNIGYIVMLYPSIWIMSWIGPQYWLPSLELIWGGLTCALSAVHTYQQVYVLRTFIGFAEGSAWPAYFTLLSAWYTPKEMGFRGALYGFSGYAASMFSGALQGALYRTLNGVGGRSGWRWLFLINGILTMIVALAGYFCYPGFPDRPNPLARLWLKDEHIRAAHRRITRLKRQNPKPLTIRSFARVFLRWELYAIGWLGWDCATMNYTSSYFNLYLRSLKNGSGKSYYSVEQLNYIPISGSAIAGVWTLILSYLSDRAGMRYPFLVINGLVAILGHSIVGAYTNKIALNYFGYYLCYASAGGFYVYWAWVSDICNYSSDLRTVIYATGTTTSYILQAAVGPHAWQAVQAPHWKIGPYLTIATFTVGITVVWPTIAYLQKKQKEKQALWEAHPESVPIANGFKPIQGKA